MVLPSTLREMSPEIFNDRGSLKIVRAAKGCAARVGDFVGSGGDSGRVSSTVIPDMNVMSECSRMVLGHFGKH